MKKIVLPLEMKTLPLKNTENDDDGRKLRKHREKKINEEKKQQLRRIEREKKERFRVKIE